MQVKSMEDIIKINPTLTPDKNEVTRHEDYYISYNPCTFDEGREETALVINRLKFLILYGDWRQAYEGKKLEECVEFFKTKSRESPELVGYTSDSCE